MLRRTQMNITYANQSKKDLLNSIFEESKRVINKYIDLLWKQKNFHSKFIDFKVDTWLSIRLQQCLGKQSLEIIKSQRKRKHKTKPIFNKDTIELDSRFIDIQFDSAKEFDCFIKLSSIGNKISLKLPSKKHKHFNGFVEEDWKMKNSCKLRKKNNKYFIDLYFEKEAPKLKTNGKEIGLDCGYKKLLISSENKVYDCGMESVYEKISKKSQGSKAFKRALVERDNKINESVNKINLNEIKTIVVEDLKNVKKDSHGKINKQFNNKLQRWSYSKVLNKLQMKCEREGIEFIKVNPAFTSQTCSQCGFKHKDNRKLESFKCLNCGYETDADFNASVNILQRVVYSHSSKETDLNEIHIFH